MRGQNFKNFHWTVICFMTRTYLLMYRFVGLVVSRYQCFIIIVPMIDNHLFWLAQTECQTFSKNPEIRIGAYGEQAVTSLKAFRININSTLVANRWATEFMRIPGKFKEGAPILNSLPGVHWRNQNLNMHHHSRSFHLNCTYEDILLTFIIRSSFNVF